MTNLEKSEPAEVPFRTVISAEDLDAVLESELEVAVVDCRFSLAEPEAGRKAYREGHIPGAVYAHLDEDLAGPIVPGVSGRHPLPDVDEFARKLGRWGIGNGTRVVAYDDAGGAIAARLWWLLRWLGHDQVAVLDGGYQAWLAAGGEPSEEISEPSNAPFAATPNDALQVSVEEIEAGSVARLVDSRGAARYRGEEEPIDLVAGHIPGALNRPFPDNLEGGKFRDPAVLRAEFEELLAKDLDVAETERVFADSTFYCGSGVTAAHNLLAMVHAGLPMARLYNGSWSEWVAKGTREVAVGDEP